ncbi:hypothetical protein [Allopusillimonas ginsengisoli]|uniref:hypothetical protein n=1 Tax=Allopusillimonas ginsengisoli TaxID=453575 RepID=UPI00101E9464|nr:hypothetical protein [Allopusillimonas ginsengisoli]TEA79264.1 hypothetical protein ERE07_07775 [Allopusillimonas ginsengisoli]
MGNVINRPHLMLSCITSMRLRQWHWPTLNPSDIFVDDCAILPILPDNAASSAKGERKGSSMALIHDH